MSPEHAKGERQLTVKSDVFELGIAAFFALCGEHPFYGDQARIMSGNAPPTARDRVSCSNLISDLLANMLRARPLLRPMPEQILSILTNGLGTA